MNYWLFKSEPSDYSYDDLVRDKRTVWDGVSNNQALMFLRAVKRGDRVFIYHTGGEKAIVGIAKVVRGAYPDPQAGDERLVVVDIAPHERLSNPVTLAAIKSDPSFADFHLVRQPRLSVMPVPPALWKKLYALGGGSKSD